MSEKIVHEAKNTYSKKYTERHKIVFDQFQVHFIIQFLVLRGNSYSISMHYDIYMIFL